MKTILMLFSVFLAMNGYATENLYPRVAEITMSKEKNTNTATGFDGKVRTHENTRLVFHLRYETKQLLYYGCRSAQEEMKKKVAQYCNEQKLNCNLESIENTNNRKRSRRLLAENRTVGHCVVKANVQVIAPDSGITSMGMSMEALQRIDQALENDPSYDYKKAIREEAGLQK